MPASLPSARCVQLVPAGPVEGRIRPPGSKSLTNRALICAALAEGRSVLRGALESEDTEVMVGGLRQVGVEVRVRDSGQTLEVVGMGGRPSRPALAEHEPPTEIFIANSGTTIRFLTAALSALGGRYRLHGVPRMHQRPIGDLVRALNQLGGGVTAESEGGCPPVSIDSRGWSGERVEVAGAVSSQYLSGLLMAAPAAGRSIQVLVDGELVSRPYVEMTVALMHAFGGRVETRDERTFIVDGTAPYRGTDYEIEPDASAASYHWAAAAITGGSVTVEGLSRDALQGDVAFVDVLQRMGCRVSESGNGITVSGRAARGVDVDMNAISDTVQTLAVVALFAEGPTTVRGVGHNRFKETDRIGDLARELRKLGATVEEQPDGMRIEPLARQRAPLQQVALETYHDHRMAMSLALAGLVIPGVRILDPACTAKTYPHYFADLERLRGQAHRWE
ncbi:3-phosphoshikimate 1-carboxyvinyltransferase [Candidatus Laterigemmans baculatus]|uniref:3-phosphoshikimate 1-carboxyvinyltransferase n=1 Tax=Candidatus Laterigemmans baculatus TaxID=2770505 RepID=UPI0013DB6F93|nr:3-phosphoshikimate 1-carboxyvinyltransferase [Candidatus Laterigemmans baculatus]